MKLLNKAPNHQTITQLQQLPWIMMMMVVVVVAHQITTGSRKDPRSMYSRKMLWHGLL